METEGSEAFWNEENMQFIVIIIEFNLNMNAYIALIIKQNSFVAIQLP